MTTANDHGQNLLAAIIPGGKELLDKARLHLNAEHFTDRQHLLLWTLLERYQDLTGGILTRHAMTEALQGQRYDSGTVLSYEETYDLLATTTVEDHEFRWSLEQLRDLAAQRATAEAYTTSMEILTRGREDAKGNRLLGHVEARRHTLQRFAEIDRALAMQEAPEGDMRDEADEMLAEYQSRAAAVEAGEGLGVQFGIAGLDAKIGGLGPGELALLAAYTSEGKTSLAVQLAWDAAVNQSRNVVVLTTETVRPVVRRRIISRHSCRPGFAIPNGINSWGIKNGTLTPPELKKFHEVLTDWKHNSSYGRFYICQVPRGATIGYCESKLLRIQRIFNIDLVIMDSLALLKADRKRNTKREELSEILMEAKQLAVTFNDGAGVPFVSPWQVSRAARLLAQERQSYDASALSETAEASNSADIIISLLAPLDVAERVAQLKMQVMKNRDGERALSIDVMVDYATSRFYTGERTVNQRGLDDVFAGDAFATVDLGSLL